MMDVSTNLLIYKQTILPIIDYLSIMVHSSTKRKIKKLHPLQNRAIRIILNLKGFIGTEEMGRWSPAQITQLSCGTQQLHWYLLIDLP